MLLSLGTLLVSGVRRAIAGLVLLFGDGGDTLTTESGEVLVWE